MQKQRIAVIIPPPELANVPFAPEKVLLAQEGKLPLNNLKATTSELEEISDAGYKANGI